MQHYTGFEPMKYRTYLTTAVIAVVMSFFGVSCGKKEKQYGAAITNRDSASVVTTYGVDMFVSENGVIRYHVIAEEWQIFDMTNPPRYSLEKGVLLEVLDTAMQVESTLVADTAYYLTDRKVWHLRSGKADSCGTWLPFQYRSDRLYYPQDRGRVPCS